ncbi:hypothetical protein [Amycolatopsis jiangsuensis]|uniref:Uncharacterized protein n=1 Tax=Amycolatopsis jiangsuensis TaxID=1181879 RepID=A0A840IYG8_9PSEU|nr:hypothetical protein [Amycolatopsis jiangsuensis]MBB4686188.1 hypothetical protein [Amycolatopsis jiangsuensis]
MEVVLWLTGMAVLGALAAVLVWVFRDRAGRLDRRFDAADQAARWRFLQQRWQAEPMARLATVQQVHAFTPRGGAQVRIVWTDSHTVQDVEIEQGQVARGDFLLVRGVGPYGVITPGDLLAHAAADAPGRAQPGR